MGGYGELSVPPGAIEIPAVAAGIWTRATPVPITNITPTGVAGYSSLAAASPPMLLQQFEIVSYAIGFSILADNTAAADLTVELALLVNGDVRHINQQTANAPAGANSWTSGAWISDLVNPLRLGAREQLALRIGIVSSAGFSGVGNVYTGIQYDANGQQVPGIASTISYNVIDLPAARRL